MICPSCTNKKTYVTQTRQQGSVHRRRYECSCGVRFTTYEVVADDELRYRRMNQGSARFTLSLKAAPLKHKRRKKKVDVKSVPSPDTAILSESNFTPNDYATELLNRKNAKAA